jgi:type II secretory pathway component GspD/PulD (secretin)
VAQQVNRDDARPVGRGSAAQKEARVFRARTNSWIPLSVGLIVGVAASPAPAQAPSTPAPVVRPAPAAVVLSRAIEAQRRGDYELAGQLFQDAVTRQDELSFTERSELNRLLPENSKALQSRRDGVEWLANAENAQEEGRTNDASNLVKRLALVEQYLKPAERQRYQKLSQSLGVVHSGGSGDVKVRNARDEVKEARALLGRFDFDEAEALARDADSHGAVFGPSEDSPRKILADVAKARSDPAALLKAARAFLQQKDLDRAEVYAHQAEKASSSFSFTMWGDSPAKVLKEVEAARAQVAKGPAASPKVEGASPPVSAKVEKKEKVDSTPTDATELLRMAREALQQKEFDKADILAHKAEKNAGTFTFSMWGDSPTKVLKDVQVARAEAAKPPTAPVKQDVKIQTVSARVEGSSKGEDDSLPVEPPMLLKLARTALEQKDFDRAESYAHQAEKTAGTFTFPVWGDTPARVLHDIELARKEAARKPAQMPETRDAGTPTSAPSSGKPEKPRATTNAAPAADASAKAPLPPPVDPARPAETEAARGLMRQARQALQAGNLVRARELVAQARARKPVLTWMDDTPDKIEADIARAESKAKPAEATKAPEPPKPTTPGGSREEALALLHTGRDQLALKKFDEAVASAQKARNMSNAHWGLFEDNPDKLIQEVAKARVKSDLDESIHVLEEGRRLYSEGDFDGATRAAYRAQKLHGPYNVWDFGDRPSKLLDEIAQAKARMRRSGDVSRAPAPPPEKPQPKQAPAADNPVAPVNHTQDDEARSLLAEARLSVTKGDLARARALTDQVRQMHVKLDRPGDLSADLIDREVEQAAQARASADAAAPPPVVPASIPEVKAPLPAPEPVVSEKARAAELVAEARRLALSEHLVEARTKALEAAQVHVEFEPNEDSPAVFLQQLTSTVRQRVESMVLRASTEARSGAGDVMARCLKAENELLAARQLASAFLLDLQPIDAELESVRKQRSAAAATPVDSIPPTPRPDSMPNTSTAPLPLRSETSTAPSQPANPGATGTPQEQGRAMLHDARLELRNGETHQARKLVEMVLMGPNGESDPYGVAAEAKAVLNSIEAEEANQHVLEARRTFDAAERAFNNHDFAFAVGIIDHLDAALLDGKRKERLGQIMNTPQMQPSARGGVLAQLSPGNDVPPQLNRLGDGAGRARVTDVPPAAAQVARNDAPEGKATVSDGVSTNILRTTEAMRNIEFQRLRKAGLDLRHDASEKFRTGQTDAALDMLQGYIDEVGQSKLDPNQIALLRRPIESTMGNFRALKTQQDANASNKAAHDKAVSYPLNRDKAEENKQKHIAELLKRYNELMRDCKYGEAESVLLQAKEIDPDNSVVTAGIAIAKRQRAINEYDTGKKNRETTVLDALNGAEDEGDPRVVKENYVFDPKVWKTARDRKDPSALRQMHRNEKEREIERKLTLPANLNFSNAPLSQVLDDIRTWHGINIHVDEPALAEEGIELSHPMNVKFEQISLKSALTLLLRNARLTYVIKDEALQITTEKEARGKLEMKAYPVADLVVPVENFGNVQNPEAKPVLGTQVNQANPMSASMGVVQPPLSLNGGAATGTPSGSTLSTFGDGNGQGGGNTVTQIRNATATQEQKLINLITGTINPKSWTEQGGPGTIDFHPLTMSLVINQTPDVQGEIADLLQSLRRLQEQEVSVEVRFISISEDFYERIGVNFNMNITNNSNNGKYGPLLVNGVFQPAGFINSFHPSNLVSGLTPAGSLTSDLNIPVNTNTFFQSTPFFGGYPGLPGAGGLTLGLAFLSDIQVFLFLEAAQGDTRTNVMQAPKLTLYNAQTATLTESETQFFVTSTQVLPLANGNITFQPTTSAFTNTTTLTLQAVISADRRFVRLSLAPNLTNVVPGATQLFPIVVPIFPGNNLNEIGQPNPPVVFTQLVQQPAIASLSVATTVSVPDGGTVLLGGLKRLSEARNEYGPPLLSKIPIISRLFKNTGYGRETESLLIMVTPRIIIQSEEEDRQTGFQNPNAGY